MNISNQSSAAGIPAPTDKVYYWVENKRGRMRQGEIRAPSKKIAAEKLKRQRIRPDKLYAAKGSQSKSLPLKAKADFIRQLAVMMESGVPLNQALDMVADSHRDRRGKSIRELVLQVKSEVESGSRLSESLREHPDSFDALFCNTLQAGEDAGKMEEVLQRLATHLEKTLRNRQRVRKALTYPIAVVIVAIALTVCMLLFVIPSFSSIYAQFKSELPALTQGLIHASNFLQENGLWVLLFSGTAIWLTVYLYKTRVGVKNAVDKVLLRAPILGHLLKTATFARWIRTLTTLNSSGVPIVSALESVGKTCGYVKYEEATEYIRQEVRAGSRISEAMLATGVFPKEMCQMIQIGEESGRLDSMMERIANRHETMLDDLVDNLSTVIEPAFMSIIGILVGVLIVGMYLPIFNMGSII